MRESEIEDYLVKRVKVLGGEIRKVKWINQKNAPDRFVMLPVSYADNTFTFTPNSLWVELKASGLDATPAQKREHNRMRSMGQRVIVINSTEQVDELLGVL